jgi:phosphotransacetylase
MIKSWREVAALAVSMGPKKLAVLAPEDDHFMRAVKEGRGKGYVEPILIGDPEKMKRVAAAVEFDIGNVEQIPKPDRQAIADLGTAMLFNGEIDLESKGQIPTSFIYRSIIREEAKRGTGRNVSVISLWYIPTLKRFMAFTDTGVNIKPDYRAKKAILRNAIFLLHVLGCSKPRIAALTGRRSIGGLSDAQQDAEKLRRDAACGAFGDCEMTEGTSFMDFFADPAALPDILLVPNLDTGNILCKLDFFLPVTRRSLVVSSHGPVLIPSRAEFCDDILGVMALGVVVAEKMKGVPH